MTGLLIATLQVGVVGLFVTLMIMIIIIIMIMIKILKMVTLGASLLAPAAAYWITRGVGEAAEQTGGPGILQWSVSWTGHHVSRVSPDGERGRVSSILPRP